MLLIKGTGLPSKNRAEYMQQDQHGVMEWRMCGALLPIKSKLYLSLAYSVETQQKGITNFLFVGSVAGMNLSGTEETNSKYSPPFLQHL